MAICNSAWTARQIQRLSLEAWPSETTEKLAFFKHRFKIAIIFQNTLITTTPNVLPKNLKHYSKFLFVSDRQSLWSADAHFHFLRIHWQGSQHSTLYHTQGKSPVLLN